MTGVAVACVAAHKKMERKKLDITIRFRVSPVLGLYLFLPFISCIYSQLNVLCLTETVSNRPRTAIRVDLGLFLHQDWIKESDDDLELSRAAQQIQDIDVEANKNGRWHGAVNAPFVQLSLTRSIGRVASRPHVSSPTSRPRIAVKNGQREAVRWARDFHRNQFNLGSWIRRP